MAIKLVYEKKVNNVRHLFASETGIPAETDAQVAYNPAYNNEPYAYTKSAANGIRKIAIGESKRQIPAEADKEMVASAYGYDVVNNKEINVPVVTAAAPKKKAAKVVEEPVVEEAPAEV